jgi:uncharacterized membrane protein YoaK (UPF0700 family)
MVNVAREAASMNVVLIVVGMFLIIAGLAIAGGGKKSNIRVGNVGVTVFGSVTQTFQSIGMAINGKREKTRRDWIGWSISGLGLIVGLIGFLNS